MLRVSGMNIGMGRKFSQNRRGRLFGNFGGQPTTCGGGNELAEDDVWSSLEVTPNVKDDAKRGAIGGTNTIRNRRWQMHQASNRSRLVGGLSLALEDPSESPSSNGKIIQQFRPVEDPPPAGVRHSAPVNVPDWSKILRESTPESPPEYRGYSMADDEHEMVPPHEYLARESARRQGSATSVFEGVGRTLKGRDMSRVRNAVWRQTGFFG